MRDQPPHAIPVGTPYNPWTGQPLTGAILAAHEAQAQDRARRVEVYALIDRAVGYVPRSLDYTQRTGGAGCYAIQTVDSGLVKIGASTSLRARLRRLAFDNDFRIAVLWIVRSSDPYTTEKALHGRFSAFRVRGDWFRLDAERSAL